MDNAWGIVRCVLDIVMQQKVNFFLGVTDFLSFRFPFSPAFPPVKLFFSILSLLVACMVGYGIPWGTLPVKVL